MTPTPDPNGTAKECDHLWAVTDNVAHLPMGHHVCLKCRRVEPITPTPSPAHAEDTELAHDIMGPIGLKGAQNLLAAMRRDDDSFTGGHYNLDRHTVMQLLEEYVANAPRESTPPTSESKHWVEDVESDGGYYEHVCIACERHFMGAKGRTKCKLCADSTLPAPSSPVARCTCWLGRPGAQGGDSREREKCAVHGDGSSSSPVANEPTGIYGEPLNLPPASSPVAAMTREEREKIEHLRSLLGSGLQDEIGTDGIDAIRYLLTLQDEADRLKAEQQAALNLLAIMHRDGGHHTEAVGFVQSCKDAVAVRTALVVEIDRLKTRLGEAEKPELFWRDEDDMACELETIADTYNLGEVFSLRGGRELGRFYFRAVDVQTLHNAEPITKEEYEQALAAAKSDQEEKK